MSEPWTQRIWWERTLSHTKGAPKATQVAPAALGRCINSHQSDLISLKRVAGETTSSTKSEHREKQPGRFGHEGDTLFPSCNCLGFSSTKPRACFRLAVPRSLSKHVSFILWRQPVRARHIRIWMVASLLRILTCSILAKCIQSWFVLCSRYRLCWSAYSCLINHRQLQCDRNERDHCNAEDLRTADDKSSHLHVCTGEHVPSL